MDDRWLEDLAGHSAMGKEIAAFDWSSSPLGAPGTWSSSLRTVTRICLTTRFPMLVTWGPELTMLYNDGYREMLGCDKHPAALGAPAEVVWREVWDVIGPQFAQVTETGIAVWVEDQRLEIDRSGYVEETWFTYSYSPVLDDDGTIGGVLDTCTETTNSMVTARRLACLGSLSTELAAGTDVADVCRRAMAVLSHCAGDVPWADLYLCDGDELLLVASTSGAAATSFSTRSRAAANSAIEERHPIVIQGAAEQRPLGIAIPLGIDTVDGVLVTGLSSQRPFDDGYSTFVHLCARNVGGALAAALLRDEEVGELRHISEVLQQAMLSPLTESPTVAAHYVPAAGGLAVGGDWCDVIDLGDGRRAIVVGDCVGHGLDAAALMGQLRSASRAVLLDGHGPAATLEAMDRFAGSVHADCATMVCAIVDPDALTMTYSVAAHPPPIVVGASGVRWLEDARGLPLNVGSAARCDAVAAIAPGERIVLYSDGLVERRDTTLAGGFQRLEDAAHASAWRDTVREFADDLLETMLPIRSEDDVVLLVDQI